MKRFLLLIVTIFLPATPRLFAQAANLVDIPATARSFTDPATLVPVTLTVSPFRLGRTEITQAEFRAVMGYNPSFHPGDNLPVENVSWWEAVRYCNLRSLKAGLPPCYDLATGACDFSREGYRLPTDAEWSAADSLAVRLDSGNVHALANLGTNNTKSIPALNQELASGGTRPVGSYPANFYGLRDMEGNVWEWCNDNRDPVPDEALPLDNPRGRPWSPERVLRGGSWLSLVSSWSHGFRSSIDPEYKSRFTGFRVCRNAPPGSYTPPVVTDDLFYEPYNRIPSGFEGRGELSGLLTGAKGTKITTVASWEQHRAELLAKWEKLLGAMPDSFPGPNVKLLYEYEEELYTGKMYRLQVEKDYWEKILVLVPRHPVRQPTPVVIVPYYDVDTPAGENLGGRVYNPPSVRSFALCAVQAGYIAVAVRWFGESYAEGYAEAVARLKLRHPGLSGLGKWVWDSHRLLDYIYSLPEVDRGNIGIIGHSLGGKMALYAAAFDPRITVAVSSELGIGFDYSNYEDYWYFDRTLLDRDPATDQHELLGLLAPRPYLLIAGETYDKDSSWRYINAAREVYSLYGDPRRIGLFNHRSGHTPSPESVHLALEWFKRFLGPAGSGN